MYKKKDTNHQPREIDPRHAYYIPGLLLESVSASGSLRIFSSPLCCQFYLISRPAHLSISNFLIFKSLAICLSDSLKHVHLIFTVTFILTFTHSVQLDCCSVCLTCQQIHLQSCLRPLFQGSSTARQTHHLGRTAENIFILHLFHFFPLSGNSLSLLYSRWTSFLAIQPRSAYLLSCLPGSKRSQQ
jgi:hypothetical protein